MLQNTSEAGRAILTFVSLDPREDNDPIIPYFRETSGLD